MARKTLTKPPLFAQIMQEEFGKQTRLAAARAELAGVKIAGPRGKAKSAAPVTLAKARARTKA